MKRAVIVIPTYNERENILKVVPWLQSVIAKITNWELHILVVDDTSPDKTYEVVTELIKKNHNVHLVINKQKSGLGGAYLKGMAYAFNELQADAVFEFDADLSHDATRIPLFLEKLDQGYDVVIGSRYIPGGSIPANWGWNRKFLSIVGNLVIALVFTNFSVRDWTSGFRAIKKSVYQAVAPELTSERFTGYTFQVGFLKTALQQKFKVVEVPFHFVDRTVGESKLGAEYIKNNLLFIFKIRAQEIKNHRLFKFVMVGGTGALIQMIALALLRAVFPFELAYFLAIEAAVISNFLLNNLWTFADRKLSIAEIPRSFVTFNFASAGSIVIQFIIGVVGKLIFGLPVLLTLPLINKPIDAGMFYAVLGILIGMFWNFFAYNRFVWKKK